MDWGDFKKIEMGVAEIPGQEEESNFFDFSLDGITDGISDFGDSASSWLDSLGSTYVKGMQIKNAIDGKPGTSAADDAAKREYENIEQGVDSSSNGGFQINKNHLIYGGVGLVAVYLLFGGD